MCYDWFLLEVKMKKIIFLATLGASITLTAEPKILALSGSTRADSYNKQLVQEAGAIAKRNGAVVTFVDLKDLPIPLYDGDLEEKSGMPENARKLKRMIQGSDGVLISTPEYNGSISAVLKNAIDWVSRKEEGDGDAKVFSGKAFALMAASPSSGGGKGALGHLTALVKRLGGVVVATETSIPRAHVAFEETRILKSSNEKKELEREVEELLQKIHSPQPA